MLQHRESRVNPALGTARVVCWLRESLIQAEPGLLHSRGRDVVQAGPGDVEAGIPDPHDCKRE